MERPQHKSLQDRPLWTKLVLENMGQVHAIARREWERFRPDGLLGLDDLQQQVILALLLAQPTQEDAPSLLRLARTIAKRRMVDLLRRSRRVAALQPEDPIADPRETPERADHLQRAVQNAIAILDKDDRELLRARYLTGMTLQQIAVSQQSNVAKVAWSISLALRRLREAIAIVAAGSEDSELQRQLEAAWPFDPDTP